MLANNKDKYFLNIPRWIRIKARQTKLIEQSETFTMKMSRQQSRFIFVRVKGWEFKMDASKMTKRMKEYDKNDENQVGSRKCRVF